MKGYKLFSAVVLCAALVLQSCNNALDVPANREVENITSSTTMLTPSTSSVELGKVSKVTTKEITLTNSDTKNTIEVKTVALESGNKGFTLVSLPTLPAKILPGGTMKIGVNFSTKSAGSFTDKIIINNEPLKGIPLSGETKGDITVEVETTTDLNFLKTSLDPLNAGLNFGNINVGETKTLSFEISNTSPDKRLSIAQVQFESNGTFVFTEALQLPLILDVNETRTLSVRYAPANVGAEAAVLSFINEQGDIRQYKVYGSCGSGTQTGICYVQGDEYLEFNGVKPTGPFSFFRSVVNESPATVRVNAVSFSMSADQGITWRTLTAPELRIALQNNVSLPFDLLTDSALKFQCTYANSPVLDSGVYLIQTVVNVTDLSTNTTTDLQSYMKVLIP